MGYRLAVHINSLRSIDQGTLPENPGTSDYMEVRVKETATLHKLLSQYMPVPIVEVSKLRRLVVQVDLWLHPVCRVAGSCRDKSQTVRPPANQRIKGMLSRTNSNQEDTTPPPQPPVGSVPPSPAVIRRLTTPVPSPLLPPLPSQSADVTPTTELNGVNGHQDNSRVNALTFVVHG